MDQQGDAGTGGFETRPYTLVFPGPRLLVWCLTNTVMNLRGHFGCRQGAMTCRGGFQTRPSGVHHARNSNAADGEKDQQITMRINRTGS